MNARQNMLLAAGTKLHHYEIVDTLGSGGMGQVYRAVDLRLNRTVAIKVLPAEFSSDPNRLNRFEQEARAASALNHPNIITIYDVGRFDASPYIAMEHVKGDTLRTLLSSGPLPLKQTQEIAIQFADGLANAHEAGIVHRDLKPENVMITDSGLVKILDFGLAKLAQPASSDPHSSQTPTNFAQTQSGMILGTVGYMSPEQARGQAVDFRSDQFAFGAIAYEMLTGRRAFSRQSIPETLTAVIREEPEPLDSSAPGTPAVLVSIIRRCLAKEPDNRYSSTRILASELRQLQQNSAQTAAVFQPRVSNFLWIKNKRFALILAALALTGLLALTFRFMKTWQAGSLEDSTKRKSIAVLPFQNVSGQSEDEYLVDGVTEALISELANIKGMFVIARNSVLPYRGKQPDLKKIEDELKVNYVVEGSVQRSGDQLRINSHLIDVKQGNELWGKSYRRTLQDVFTLQDDIAKNIASALQVALEAPEGKATRLTENREAYDAYLHGKYLLDREEGASKNLESVRFLERAVELDPNFALARANLAIAYRNRFFRYEPEKEWERKAFVEVEKALLSDPNVADAYAARGRLMWTRSSGFQHEKAIRDFRRALELNPNLAEAHRYLGIVYAHLGFFEESLKKSNIAQTLDPISPGHFLDRTMLYLYWQKYDLAFREEQTVLQDGVSAFKGILLSYLGRDKEAREYMQRILTVESKSSEGVRDHPSLIRSSYALLLARNGEFARAEEHIEWVIQNDQGFSHFHHAEYNIASAYALMGNKELAVEWLQKTADHGFPCYPLFATDPNLKHLRGYPPFQTFLGKMKNEWERYRGELQMELSE